MLSDSPSANCPPPETVFVIGVGRSGTTLVYRVLQGLFSHLYGRAYYSTYEPLIWQHALFNRPYEECAPYFGKTSSLSWDGIHAHLSTPMFVQEGCRVGSATDFPVFSHLSSSGGPAQPHLAKLIRMNGRLPLLRAIHPRARFIVVIRNPLDTLNSVKNLFSFYGDDFYPSDFPRFADELGDRLMLRDKACSWGQRQCEYVYQMTLSALQFALNDENTHVLDYDLVGQNSAAMIDGLCAFLGERPVDAMYEAAGQRMGPVTKNIKLSSSEFGDALEYLHAYADLLESHNLLKRQLVPQSEEHYAGLCSAPPLDESLEGLTTNQLRNKLRQERARNRKLQRQLEKFVDA